MRVLVAGRLSRRASDRDQTGFDSQEREAVRWAKNHRHNVVAVVADYRSGRSGLEARPHLRPWVTEPDKLAQYEAIVALKVDRLTRGDREETAKLEQWAREHRKALMVTEADVQFPSEGNDGIRWDMMLRMAHQEWLNTSERYSRMLRNRREVGSAVGRAPWGYSIVRQTDGRKIFEPTSEGRRWVPLIFDAVIGGKSLREVAAWLDAEGASGGPWDDRAVLRLVSNPIMYGHRLNAGNLETEALVSYSTWQAARAALESRAKPGRGTVVRPKALLSPVCGNPECNATGKHPSPLYRQFSKATHGYYRCNGRGPRAKGCGLMIRCEVLDSIVTEAMRDDLVDNFHVERVFVPGDDRSDQIGKLREQAADAYRKGDKAKFRELDERADELEALPNISSHWQELATCDNCGKVAIDQARLCHLIGHRVITRGEHFASLDDDAARREYISQHEVAAWKDGGEVLVSIIPRELAV